MRASLLLLLTLLLCGAAARAEFYTWKERDGREFYTNDREKIPAEYRDSARPVEVRDERVTVAPAPGGEDRPPAAQRPRKQTDRNGRGEEHWRKRAGDLRRKLREQQTAHDLLVQQDREEERAGRPSTAKGKKAAAARKKKQEKIAGKIARLKHELEVELPDEARKAEALPGWLR